jgi:tetratricopeptide (TPR) repeat protein
MTKEQNTKSNAQTTDPAATPVASPPADPHLEELKELASRHGRSTLLAVVIFLLVAVPIFLVRYYRDSAKDKAASMLSSATQPGDMENIFKEYPKTPSAPLAILNMARILYDRQEYVKAQTTYEDFLSRYAEHQLAPVAQMGKAHCMEGKGQELLGNDPKGQSLEGKRMLEDALKSFEAFAVANKDHFLTTQAILAKARCLHHLGKTKEALIVVEDFLTANAKSPWSAHAEEMIVEFKRPPEVAATTVDSLIPPTGTNMPLPSLLPALPQFGN